MSKKVVKSIFYTFFAGFIIWSVYADAAASSSPGTLVTVGLILALLTAYIENKKLLKRLKVKTDRLEELIDTFSKNCPDLITYKNTEFRYIGCNKAVFKLLQKKHFGKIINKTPYELLPQKTAATIIKNDKKVLETGKSIKYTLPIKYPGKGERIYDIISAPTIKNGRVTGIITIARDITIRERMRFNFIEKHQQLSGMLNNLPLAFFITDKEGRYIKGNSEFQELAGHTELSRLNIAGTFTEIDERMLLDENNIILREKKPLITEHIYKFPDKNPTWYKEYRVPFINAQKEVIGITVFLLNIQKEKEAEHQKERFVATLSHDLKTPVIAQVRSLEMLINGMFGELNAEQKEMLKLILDSCNNMYDMVSTVLFSYKFENEEIKLQHNAVNLVELTAECCNNLAKKANEKNLEIIIRPDANIYTINGDKNFLQSAISNILENSISYAFERTKAEIIIKKNHDNLEFRIITDSPFIKEEALSAMFDKYRGHSSYNKIGFCLKLHLAKQIIEAHGGSLIAESRKNDKNTFGFVIPLSKNIASSSENNYDIIFA